MSSLIVSSFGRAGLAVLVITTLSCGGGTDTGPTAPVPVATVTTAPSSQSLFVGGTQQLTATTLDATGATLTGRTITWTTSDATKATVNSTGLVTAVAVGTATITATSEGKSGTSVVTVAPVPVATVTVAPASPTVIVGSTQQLTATTLDATGASLTGRTITWTTSDTTKATVSSTGLVTAVAVGTATITASSEGKSGTAAVTVAPIPVVSVTISPIAQTVAVGQTLQLSATPLDNAGVPLTGRSFVWSSVNSDVATVSLSGLVTALSFGKVTITATSEGKTGQANLTVVDQSGIPSASGFATARLDSIAYTPNQGSNQAIAGAQVTVESISGTTNSSGGFFLPMSGQLSPGYHTVIASAPAFIPQQLPVGLGSIGSLAAQVGLYPAPAAALRPGFLKGVVTHDAGPWIPDYMSQGLFAPTYDRIKQIGGNLVAFADPVFIRSYDSATKQVTMAKSDAKDPNWRMLNAGEYAVLAGLAHTRGMQFMLDLATPLPYNGSYSPADIWNVPSTNTAFWDAWFAAFQPIVLEYAAIARDLNIEYLSLGQNMLTQTELSAQRWATLIQAIRRTGYAGKLVYFAGSQPTVSTYETDYFNTTEGQHDPTQFMKLFDAIGININNVVAETPTTALAQQRQSMRVGIANILDRATSAPVPILVRLATPSVFGGAVKYDFIESFLSGVNDIAATRTVDMMQQADVYEALFEYVNRTPTGNGRVMGVMTWGYSYLDDYNSFIGRPMALDKSANSRGKPAESVLAWWFQRW